MRNAFSFIRLITVLVLLVGFAPTATTASATTQPQVSITPGTINVPVCQTSQVGVAIADVNDLYGFDIKVEFNPQAVSVAGITHGPFLAPGFSMKQIDNISGTARYIMTELNPSVPVTGSGVLFYLQLRGRILGASTPLTITKVDLANRSGVVYAGPIGQVNGFAQVTAGDPLSQTSLIGVVTNTVSGLPVPGARVTLTDSFSLVYTTTVAANGSYTFACADGQPIATGVGSLVASALGYAPKLGYSPAVTLTTATNTKHAPLTPLAKQVYPLYFRVDAISGANVGLGWATTQEVNTTGFNLFRADSFSPAQAAFIHYEPTKSVGGTGAAYTYTDTVPTSGVWWYWLQEVGPTGAAQFAQPVSATVNIVSPIIYNHFIWLPGVLNASSNQ
jgi:hypothetical protein